MSKIVMCNVPKQITVLESGKLIITMEHDIETDYHTIEIKVGLDGETRASLRLRGVALKVENTKDFRHFSIYNTDNLLDEQIPIYKGMLSIRK